MLGRKVIYVRCLSCSYNNVTKSICLLDKKSNSCLYRKNYMQVRAFERYIPLNPQNCKYSNTCLKRPLKNRQNKGLKDKWQLNEGQKYCRMLSWSILQYFWPAFSHHRSWKPILIFFLSGRLRQVLLYIRKWISLPNDADNIKWVLPPESSRELLSSSILLFFSSRSAIRFSFRSIFFSWKYLKQLQLCMLGKFFML